MNPGCLCLYPPLTKPYVDHAVPNKSVDNRQLLGPVMRYPYRHGAPRAVCVDLTGGPRIAGELECHGLSKYLAYSSVDSATLLKSALTAGDWGILTFRVYNDSMLFWRQQSPEDPVLGVASAIVVGYDDDDQWFILRTVRGDSWGDDGYCYYPYSDWGYHSYCVVTSGEKISNDGADNCCGQGVCRLSGCVVV